MSSSPHPDDQVRNLFKAAYEPVLATQAIYERLEASPPAPAKVMPALATGRPPRQRQLTTLFRLTLSSPMVRIGGIAALVAVVLAAIFAINHSGQPDASPARPPVGSTTVSTQPRVASGTRLPTSKPTDSGSPGSVSSGFRAPTCGGPLDGNSLTPTGLKIAVTYKASGVHGQYQVSAKAINSTVETPLVVLAQLLLVKQGLVVSISSNIAPMAYPEITLSNTKFTHIDTIKPTVFITCEGAHLPAGSYDVYGEVFASKRLSDTDFRANIVDAAVSGPIATVVVE